MAEPLPPLTHHEILSLVGPFTQRGRRVDLAASDRLQRRLHFVPIDRPAVEGGLPALRETLSLDLSFPGRHLLVRELRGLDGLCATLQTEGDDLAAMLSHIDAVPAERQLRCGPGLAIAFGQRIVAGAAAPELLLREAFARLPMLTLEMKLTGVRGFPAEIEIRPVEGVPLTLPRDLLSVLGSPWTELGALQHSWQSNIAVRGDGRRRSDDAEARFMLTVQHLQRTLAEPPAHFNQRHRAARWGVTVREMLPLGIGLLIVGTALLFRREGAEQPRLLALLANVAPPLMMALFFMRREMPRIGLPRPPPRLPADAWRPPT
jgi:hypothetical protein